MIRSDQVSDLYASPNGDRWLLGRRLSGELVVCHGSGDSVVHGETRGGARIFRSSRGDPFYVF